MPNTTIQDFINLINTASAPAQTAPGAQSGLQLLFNSPAYTLAYGSQDPNNNTLQRFFNSPEYALLYGQPTAAEALTKATAGSYDPTQAFKQDPGYEFAQQEAARILQQYGAARGLLESGPLQLELQRQAQGMADQNYQRWLEQQSNLFNQFRGGEQGLLEQYQNQLAGLAQFGAGQTGGQQAIDINNLLAQIAAQGNLNTGQNLANAYLTTGGNIASLFGNQGVLNANAILNTAAAQANNLLQGNIFTSQLLANQRAGLAQGANSSLFGQGLIQGYGSIF